MKQTTTVLAVLLGLTSMSAIAAQNNAFHHESSLDYQTNSQYSDVGIWNAKYRYYVAPVDQSNGPLALNGFLAQTTNLGANYSYLDFDKFETDIFDVDGTYVFDSKWFVSANYRRVDPVVSDSNDFDAYGAKVGYYFNRTSAVTAFYHDRDSNSNIDERYGLNLRSFIPLQAVAGVDLTANWTHASYVEDSDDIFSLGADLYVNNAWSAGVGYTNSDIVDNSAVDIRTAYWTRISDNFLANFNLSRVFDSDLGGVGMGVGVVGRF